ncbi:MAG: acetate--CoA ligase family protein [Thermoplasmata archaeon]|nr:acetate--CoA ligase family protein [Thermoplasmata archaeon]
MELADIKYLFEPRAVAVIGASQEKNKVGCKLMENLMALDFKGKIYPVNTKGGEIYGMKVHTDINDIGGPVDMAVIVIPAKFVYSAVESCGRKGVKFLVIITSGFSEVGNLAEERKIVEYAHAHGMRVLGPNIFGIYSGKVGLNATFGPRDINRGNVAIITQSGALGIAMIGKTATENIGLSAIVSVGNKADIEEAELLEYLIDDEETKIILLYIEGVHSGERMVEFLKKATQKKPVIVIKSGRSKRGAMAAASHTGALAGADEIFDSIMKQCGVLRAESLQEAFNWCKFLASSPLPTGRSTVIITNGGGVGVMATDACEKYKVELLDDPVATKEIFGSVTPDFGSTKNPIDITGQALAKHYDGGLCAALKDTRINAVIALYCQTADFDKATYTDMIVKNVQKYREGGKPIVFSLVGGEEVEECIRELRRQGAPVFGDVYEAVQCFGILFRHLEHLSRAAEEAEEPDMDLECMQNILSEVRAEGRTFLLSHEAQSLMKAAGIPVPESKIATNIREAVEFSEQIGYPVVMKIASKDIIHKSDAGGVALDLLNKEEVMDAYQAIIRNARKYKPDAVIKGVEIVRMIQKGTETIIGARRDRAFGPVIMFGLGGIYVEVLKDVAFRALPLDRREIISMLKDIRSYSLLLGVRGETQRDIESIVDTIIKLGKVIRKCEDISDVEINPLTVYEQGHGAMAVDVRILLTDKNRGEKK